ncbi:MAG: radical SAM protein [Candidatus Omnitrophota bacterium]
MDNFRLDSHKLMYHASAVNQWLEGKEICPIYVELGLYGGCNHRCVFCAFDYLKYKPGMLKESCFKKFLSEASKGGVRAVLFSGEGEPLLHPKAAEIIAFAKKNKIDTALSTNGVFLDYFTAQKILSYLSWMRVSLNAGSAKNYAFIHGTSAQDFQTVLDNLRNAVSIKRKNKYSCVIGVQLILLPENSKEVLNLARRLREIGVDYFTVKPFSRHPLSIHNVDTGSYRENYILQNKLAKYANENFKVIFRQYSFDKICSAKPYERCLGFDFITHITASGDVLPCNAFVGKKEFVLGNICKNSLSAILKSRKRKVILNKIYRDWDINKCRKSCRLDEINCYLWDLKHQVRHHNFI